MSPLRTRFYREVVVSAAERGYGVLLDGRSVKTPSGSQLFLPTHSLAEAVAAEWRAQGDKVRLETMLLTKLANTALDRVAADRATVLKQILAFGRSDLVCYRGEAESSLADRQARAWDPLLEWVDSAHDAKLKTGVGLTFIEQPEDSMLALERAIAKQDDFALAGLHAAATLCGSAVIALALAGKQLDATDAFEAAHVDELYQWEHWGKDAEAAAKTERERTELIEIARFLELARGN